MVGGDDAPRRVWLVCTLVVAVACVATSHAHAADAALAETLYQQGRVLMGAGHIDQACEKFAESQRIDPATGTLLNLAACRQQQGRLASAWADFKDAEAAARRDGREDRVQFAREQLATIEPRLSYLTIYVARDARVRGLDVRLDKQVIGEASWGVPAPVDPGAHVVNASAPGKTPFVYRVNVPGQAFRTSVTVTFGEATAAAEVVATSTEEPEAGSRRGSTAAWVAGGVGGAALIAGTIFGIRTFSLSKQRDDLCPMDICRGNGLELERQAKQSATVADISFAVALVGLSTATYLAFFHSPSSDSGKSTASLAPSLVPLLSSQSAGLSMHTTW